MKTNLISFVTISLLAAGSGCSIDSVSQPGGGGGPDAGGGGGGPDGGGGQIDNRVTDQLQLLYRFQGTVGQSVVSDTSGVGQAADLTIADTAQVTWDATGGLTFTGATIAQYANPITKVIDACKLSNAISVEAWVMNTGVVGNGRIVTSAIDNADRNFALKQADDDYEFRLRTSVNSANGDNPASLALTGSLTTNEQHIVWTRDAVGVANFYLDGQKLSPDTILGSFANWDLSYGIAVGNEPSLDRPWAGTIYLAAVYCKELTQAEVTQNYDAGH